MFNEERSSEDEFESRIGWDAEPWVLRIENVDC